MLLIIVKVIPVVDEREPTPASDKVGRVRSQVPAEGFIQQPPAQGIGSSEIS